MAAVINVAGDARTSETIDLCKLAREIQANDAFDRGTLYRTTTWFTSARTLRSVHDDGEIELPEGVARLVDAIDFYWVWLEVAAGSTRAAGFASS